VLALGSTECCFGLSFQPFFLQRLDHMSLGESGAQLDDVLAELSASGQLFRDGEPDAAASSKKAGGLFTWRKKTVHEEPENGTGDKVAPIPITPSTTPNAARKPGLFALGRKKVARVSGDAYD
jgi:hypothetical protein